jgi:hypothetical protein
MPALKNKKSERFAQSIAAGHDAEEAMRRAGYAPDRRNAPRMRRRPDIAARILELVAIAETKRAATIAAAPAAPDRAEVSDPFELAAWRAYDAATAIGDQRGARAALALVAKARTAPTRKAADGAEDAPAPRRLWFPEAFGLPADAPPSALDAVTYEALATPESVRRDRADASRSQRQAALMRERMGGAMAEYRARVAAMSAPGEETPAQRVAAVEAKRRGVAGGY